MCPICEKEHKEEQKKYESIKKQEKFNGLIAVSGIPPRFQSCRFDNFKTDIHKDQSHALSVAHAYVDNFTSNSQQGACLTFCGKPGTGKTHLACAVGIAIMKTMSTNILYAKTYNALLEIKKTFNKNAELSEMDIVNKFLSPSLLILDEVGIQFGTETEKILIYQIINGRYEFIRPTIIISNQTKEELTEYLGERCVDRLREGGGAVVPFGWDSYRGRK